MSAAEKITHVFGNNASRKPWLVYALLCLPSLYEISSGYVSKLLVDQSLKMTRISPWDGINMLQVNRKWREEDNSNLRVQSRNVAYAWFTRILVTSICLKISWNSFNFIASRCNQVKGYESYRCKFRSKQVTDSCRGLLGYDTAFQRVTLPPSSGWPWWAPVWVNLQMTFRLGADPLLGLMTKY